MVFTSYRDDAYGGDSNGDGSSVDQPGDWTRIYLSNHVSSFSRLEHCVLRFGGGSSGGIVYLRSSDIPIKSSRVSDSAHVGIYTYNSSPLIESSTISDNAAAGVYLRD